MPKNNRICHTCNRGYYHCSSCPTKGKTESFYNMFCSERCSKIFKVLSDETFKHVTTEECKEKLQELNVNKEEVFKENVRKHIDRVFAVESKIIVESLEVFEKAIEDNKETVENTGMVKMAAPRKTRKKRNSEVD